tara:strand:- start:5138 stop:6247 length:1110 start_codon:yes stop_codon:yes gene_type:complete
MTFNNFYKKYDFFTILFLVLLPLITIIGIPLHIYYNGIVWQEPVMFVIGWFLAGSGITMGYHRLFAHKTFKAMPVLEWILMLCGSMALQNTIIKWCSDHRRHHKKLDTIEDPYSITKGFFHAHIGWIFKKSDYNIKNVSDLMKKSAVKFQNKYYWSVALFLSFGLPLLIGLLYGRPIGGLLWGGFLRVTLVHHFTFFINSLCHYLGKRDYEFDTTARDSWIAAIFTFGEGYHNYHHKFQWDYRNGIKWYNFDPSKWLIKFLSIFKITYSLKKVSKQNILKARLNTLNRKINEVNLNNIYSEKIQIITENAMKNLELWKKLEFKYRSLKRIKVNKDKKQFYKQKVKLYNLEIQQSLSALMIIFSNLKNLN